MKLNQIKDNPGARKKRMRIGRGIGSGKGKTAGRGHKGQKSRTGVRMNGFEGGQTPLHRRLPKRGFNNIFRGLFAEINIGALEDAIMNKRLNPKDTITAQTLVDSGLIRRAYDGLRLLGKGTITKAITIEVVGASQAAIAAVEKAGGKVVITAKSSAAA